MKDNGIYIGEYELRRIKEILDEIVFQATREIYPVDSKFITELVGDINKILSREKRDWKFV